MGLLSTTYFYFALTSLQTNTVSTNSNFLLKTLFDLHQHHCGDTATCGSSEHVEPSQFIIPIPCCIPCSCLPSCVEQQNCCPWSVNGTYDTLIPITGLDDIVVENRTNGGLIFDEEDNESRNKTGEREMQEHRLDGDRNANNIELINEDSEVRMVKDIKRASETCMRPQVFNKPNMFLDSQAYMMVANCPDEFEDRVTIGRCTARMGETALLDMIPVTSMLTKLSYKNKHCLACNEKIQPKHIIEWRAEIVSNGARRYLFFPNPDVIVNALNGSRSTFNNIHFTPVEEDLAKRCKAYDVMTCNQTGHWDIYDELMENVCLDGYQLPVINRIDKQWLTFKNIGCFHCNIQRDLIGSRLSCGYWRRQLGSMTRSFSVTLNLRSTIPDSSNRRLTISAPYIEQDVLQQFPHQRCRPGTLEIVVSSSLASTQWKVTSI